MINTVGKFIDVSGFNRGDNYPSIQSLVFKMIELKAQDNTLIDIISFFLYDGEAMEELLDEYRKKEEDIMSKYFKTKDCWEEVLAIRKEGDTVELFIERLNML